MGVIRAGVEAVKSNLQDQWKDLISCENMPNDLLMMKKTTQSGVISNGSIIRVMPGQCAVICGNGEMMDIVAEEGDYIVDGEASPSIFAGQFKDTFKDMWERFKFSGVAKDQQEVYFFNMKEIMNNKFGTITPVIYQDWSYVIPNKITGEMMPIVLNVRCHGNYTFKIIDPSLFIREISGTANYYSREDIAEQIRSEVLETIQTVLNELGKEEYKIPVTELPSQSGTIKKLMEERRFEEQINKRGIDIVNFVIESITIDKKSEEYINEYMLGLNTDLREGKIAKAYAEALKEAASNANGSMNGFMGLGMMNSIIGTNGMEKILGNKENKVCPNCKTTLPEDSKFCNNCGAKL